MRPQVSDGDGTVPLWSLETGASTTNYYVRHSGAASASGNPLESLISPRAGLREKQAPVAESGLQFFTYAP